MKASIIIPTFGRSLEVIERTLSSLLKNEKNWRQKISDIIVIDQNDQPLLLDPFIGEWQRMEAIKGYQVPAVWPIFPNSQAADFWREKSAEDVTFIHLFGLRPSVTMAKNFGITFARGEVIIFFDDDVEVMEGNIARQLQMHETREDLGVLGGREHIHPPEYGRSLLRTFFIHGLESFFKLLPGESIYLIDGHYVGRVHPTSMMFSNYSMPSAALIPVDAVRGCNASVKRKVFFAAGGFDPQFQGNALREETDFCLRVLSLGYQNYYSGESEVIHYRQKGGCNNLAQTYTSVISKFENELIFQKKHFAETSVFFFLFRLIPIMLENLKGTLGLSFILWIQYGWRIHRERRIF